MAYIPLPAYQVPRNAMLDFSGLNAGIDAINERNQQDRLAAERKDERAYQRGRNAMADKRYAEETAYRRGRDTLADTRYADETSYNRGRQGVVDQRAATEFDNAQADRKDTKFTEKVKLYAPHIEKYVINEKDPALRAQRWNDVLSLPGLEGAPKQFLDPVTGPDLFMSTARKHMDGKYGKTGAIFKDKSGNYSSVQFAEDGSRKIEPFDAGMTPARGVMEVGDELVDKADGSTVRNVAPNLAAAEEAKAGGKNEAEVKASMPKARAGLRALETQHRNVKATIARALPMVDGWTSGLAGQTLSKLGGTEAKNLENLLNTVKANLGFDKLQDMRDNSPTGGALGQVSNIEIGLLQSAFASVEQSQDPKQLRDNMTYLVGLLDEMQDNRRMAFDDTYGGQNRPQASQKTGKTFTWSPDGGLQEVK